VQTNGTLKRPASLTVRVLAVALAILAAPGLFQGCSGCTCEECFGAGVADGVRHDAAKDYVYSSPIADTEREVRGYATATGYALPADPFTRTSRLVGKHTMSEDRELRVEVFPVGKERYRLELTLSSSYTAGDGGVQRSASRDLAGEWSVASHVDAAFAAKTEEKAEKNRDRARTVGRGCDRGCELGCRACETCDRVLR
jgi:hypothetical protein